MTTRPLKIVIAGGGTAGWMTANLLAKHGLNQPLHITLVESPDIGIIGVGEGSTPTLKRFFSDMDIAEQDWMPACNATYKVSIRFEGWSPGANIPAYAHPFISQLDTFSERAFYANCFHRRLGQQVNTTPGDFLFNGWLAKHQLSPVTPPNFPFRIEYGYHFDSGRLGNYLKHHATTSLGVIHKALTITAVRCHANGDIASLQSAEGEVVEGDFFIDCTGFKSLLLQQTLGIPFSAFKANLVNDSAVVCPTPTRPILPVETRSTALSAGWAWQIPLTNRTGNGYVYSSDFISHDQAAAELCHHLGLNENDAELRQLSMKVGQVTKHWAKNCLAVGLSQGFIEPLEATALHLVQTSVEFFIDHIKQGGFTETQRNAFNRIISERFERVRDYIVAHYRLNTRKDSDYWLANQHNNNISDALLHLLNVWYQRGDLAQEIQRQQLDSHFGNTSWHCLLAGYGIFPPLVSSSQPSPDLFQENDLARFFNGCLLNFSPQ